ncbi:MAG: hypothetical protein Q4B43_05620 [Bacteroidota bacterium]|nr:hypothetical protein [Bacteroidota bacterium]
MLFLGTLSYGQLKDIVSDFEFIFHGMGETIRFSKFGERNNFEKIEEMLNGKDYDIAYKDVDRGIIYALETTTLNYPVIAVYISKYDDYQEYLRQIRNQYNYIETCNCYISGKNMRYKFGNRGENDYGKYVIWFEDIHFF